MVVVAGREEEGMCWVDWVVSSANSPFFATFYQDFCIDFGIKKGFLHSN